MKPLGVGEKALELYWVGGYYYLRAATHISFSSEAAAYRYADGRGYTHIEVQHAWYKIGDGLVEETQIPPQIYRVPKRYRQNAPGGIQQ